MIFIVDINPTEVGGKVHSEFSKTFWNTNIHVFSQSKAVFKDAVVAFSDAKVRVIKYMAIKLHLMKIWPAVQRDRET